MAFSLTMTLSPASAPAGPDADVKGGRLDLTARAARGDAEAIVALYNDHHAHVRAFARRLVGDDALAEDVVHEVFLSLSKALARFRGECSVRSYLISVAAKRAHRHVRAAARRRAMEGRFAREPVDHPVDPHAAAQRHELAALLTRALDTLPVDQRVAFVLCEVEERSSVEVERCSAKRTRPFAHGSFMPKRSCGTYSVSISRISA